MLEIKLTINQKKRMVRNHCKHMLDLINKRLQRPNNHILLDYFKNDKLIQEVIETEPDELLALNSRINNYLQLSHSKKDINEALKEHFPNVDFLIRIRQYITPITFVI